MSISGALKWSFLAEVASKAVTPLVYIVLVRLLTPEDFGVVTAAVMVVSFSQIFWEAGLGRAIVQYRGDVDSAANAAFWINCILGVAIAGLLVASSELVAEKIFHDTRVGMVLKLMSIQVVLASVVAVHTALLQREMRFRQLFWVRATTAAVPGLLSIPLAMAGLGYWALVAGALVGQLAQVCVLWAVTGWRPFMAFDSLAAQKLWGFGAWVALSGALAWAYAWADSLIVGMYLGSHDLGLYRTGNYLVMTAYSLMFGPLLPVLYSHFSAIQNDPLRVKDVLGKAVRVVTFISIPVAFVMYALSGQIGTLVFGDEWEGIGSVIGVMALVHGYAWTVGLNGEAYRAIGRPDLETKAMGAGLIVYAFGYWLSVRMGFETFLWTRLGLVAFGIWTQLWLARIAVGSAMSDAVLSMFRVSIVGIPLVMMGRSLSGLGPDSGPWALASSSAWAIAAIGYIWFVGRKSFIPELVGIVAGRNRAESSVPG